MNEKLTTNILLSTSVQDCISMGMRLLISICHPLLWSVVMILWA